MSTSSSIQHLLSLPPAMARAFAGCTGLAEPGWIAAHDPPGAKLGSGGGVAALLFESWQRSAPDSPLEEWLEASQKLLLLAGGQSRRLPAYAATGKLLLPMPVLRWATAQNLEQTLLDLQAPGCRELLAAGAPNYRAMVFSGDVYLRFAQELPELPQVDVLGFGMWVRNDVASQFGVFFSARDNPGELEFFRQKPDAEEILELARTHFYLVDTGMWLLSARAIGVLLGKCGWDTQGGRFVDGGPAEFELYAGFGLSLGRKPARPDSEISALSSAVLPLPDAEFYHLGTSRQLIESASALQNLQLDQTKLGKFSAQPHPDQYILNSVFEYPLRRQSNHSLWVENSMISAGWELGSEHVLTGIPPNDWDLRIESGVCLDFAPVGESGFCCRAYGMDDLFRGPLGSADTLWFGRPASQWFAARGIDPAAAGLQAEGDIQQAPVFPVLEHGTIDPRFLEWLFAALPEANDKWRPLWLGARRLSAEQICNEFHPQRHFQQRREYLTGVLSAMAANYRWNPFYRLDLDHTAKLFARSKLPPPEDPAEPDAITGMHAAMFRAAVLRHSRSPQADELEREAFHRLQEGIISHAGVQPAIPHRTALDDQIIWGRSPVRIDLAGGWTDTPPYCLKHGGSVVNVALDLNGQPPIQVFARVSAAPELVVRSIDLGVETRVRTYEELGDFACPGSEFALAKAALALAGFLPRFRGGDSPATLRELLGDFGGGLEVSLLAAVPKGSGLGTSSILAATLLGVLSDFCGLGWDQATISSRTLALEQLLTTGGGWQDQIGGITRGIKLVETLPGLDQTPSIRWVPEHFFGAGYANRLVLLYYTGLTRLAKNILQEIVRGMFLNRSDHLEVLRRIGGHAQATYEVLQRETYPSLCAAVRKTWELNQALDPGTNPPAVAAILKRVEPWLAAAKLPGAGGGGYLLMLAKDEEAAGKIRGELGGNPPNPRARFVNFELSRLGLQITRS